jgi:hypothetical protein
MILLRSCWLLAAANKATSRMDDCAFVEFMLCCIEIMLYYHMFVFDRGWEREICMVIIKNQHIIYVTRT